MRPSEDASLVREVAAGSQDALASLYDRHADAIHAAARRLTSDRQVAEEVVQEVFLTLWNRAELYDPSAGSLSAWLHAIARNRTVDRLRAAGRRPNLVPLSTVGVPEEHDTAALERLVARGRVVGSPGTEPGPEAALQSAELRDAVRSALDEMPDAERTVIVLAYQDDLSQSEIAGRLGWPLGTVKTRTRRALHRLRGALGEWAARGERDLAPLSTRRGSNGGDDDGPR